MHKLAYLVIAISTIAQVASADEGHGDGVGSEFRVGNISIQGAKGLSEDQALKLLGIDQGDPLSTEALNAGIERLLSFYDQNGKPFCQISTGDFSLRDKEWIDFSVRIDEGPEVRIDRIEIFGNKTTQVQVIHRELKVEEGDLYDQRQIQASHRRLKKLGFFERVYPPEISYDNDSEQMVLSVVVEEGKTSRIDGAVGYIPRTVFQNGYLTGHFDLSFVNLVGTARVAKAKWARLDPKSSDLRLKYQEPWIFGIPLTSAGDFKQTERPGYVQTVLKMSFKTPILDDLYGELTAGWEKVVPDSLGGFGMARTRTWTGAFALGYDTQDDRSNPKSGGLYRLSFRAGTRRNFTTTNFTPDKDKTSLANFRVDLSQFLSTSSRHVIALSLHAWGIKSNERLVPLSDKIRLGGANTIRGYREEQFTGVRAIWTNLEYRYLLSPKSRAFAFVDAGAYLDKKRDSKGKIETVDERPIGYGAGIRIRSRAGILGIDYGLGKKDKIDEGKLHFSLANEF